MINLTYNPDKGFVYRDGQCHTMADAWAKSVVEVGGEVNITASTANIFLAIRVAVRQGKVPADKVRFYFKNAKDELIEIRVYSSGAISPRPDGFCEFEHECLMELM